MNEHDDEEDDAGASATPPRDDTMTDPTEIGREAASTVMADPRQPGRALSLYRNGAFPETAWTMVLSARHDDTTRAARALEALCRAYWYPIYAYARRRGNPPAKSEDLAQDFFLRLLSRDGLAEVSPEKGRLRSFLLIAFKRFMANEYAKETAEKRGGGIAPLAIDQDWAEERYHHEPSTDVAPDRLFERQWALTLLANVLDQLAHDYDRRGESELFDALKGMLVPGSAAQPYKEIAARLERSEGAIKVAAHRLRRDYREALRSEIAQTVSSDAEVDEEIRYLVGVFG